VLETFPFRLGVRIDAIVRFESAGSITIPGFVYINYTAPANRKKDAPLHALGGRIATLAESQQFILGVKRKETPSEVKNVYL